MNPKDVNRRRADILLGTSSNPEEDELNAVEYSVVTSMADALASDLSTRLEEFSQQGIGIDDNTFKKAICMLALDYHATRLILEKNGRY